MPRPSLTAALAALTLLAAGPGGHAQPRPPSPVTQGAAPGAAPIAPPASKTGDLPSPIRLSDPDGQELLLEDLDIRAAVQGPLSLTELEMRFRNPHPRRMEGRFVFTLPPRATVSRFAKEVAGHLMEGEVVERLKAHRVYDTILQQMRDPALLEQDQGNRFSARIFPIEAGAEVRLVLSYTELLPLEGGVRTFRVPLQGLPQLGHFRFHGSFGGLPGEVAVSGSGPSLTGPSRSRIASVQTLDLEETRWQPSGDVAVVFRPEGRAARVHVLEAGEFTLAAIRPDLPPVPAGGSLPWSFYVDTSASSAEGAGHRIQALAEVLAALPAQDPVEVLAFDLGVQSLYRGTAGEAARRVGPALRQRLFLGGTDLTAALTHLKDAAAAGSKTRFVLVTDGVATLGATERRDLQAVTDGLPRGVLLSALVLGAREDASVLDGLVQDRGRVVRVPFTDTMADRAREGAAALAVPPGASLRVEDSGSEWVYPRQVSDVQPGDEVLVVARRKPGQAQKLRLVRSDGGVVADVPASQATPLGPGFAPLLEREGYRATLEHLADREASEPEAAIRTALQTEQVRVSVAHRVLHPRTTLLVLETEADYQRFGLERTALADILTVGPAGITTVDRHAPAPAVVVPQVERAPEPIQKPSITRIEARKEAKARVGAAAADDDDPPEFEGPLEGKGEEEATLGAEGQAGRDEDGVADLLGTAPGTGSDPGHASVLRSLGSGGAVENRASRGAVMDLEEAGPSRQDVSGDGRAQAPPAPEAAAPAGTMTGSGGLGTRGAPAARTAAPVARPKAPQRPGWTRWEKVDPQALAAAEKAVAASPLDRAVYNTLTALLLDAGQWARLREVALLWQPLDADNPQVYEVLGEADLNLGRSDEAIRAFSSLVEVAPAKTELLQRAGLLLARAGAATLAETPLRRAVQLRPDRVNGHRHLALALWLLGRIPEAAAVLESALPMKFPSEYGNTRRVLEEELGILYRAWQQAEPSRTDTIAERARQLGVDLARTDALRITLAWETDANDVDLHVVDPRGEECMYNHRDTADGLTLYEDITRGFGPEVVRAPKVVAGEYSVGVNYFSAGPMGVSRGVLVVLAPAPGGGRDAPRILPFRLVPGSRDMRLLHTIAVPPGNVRR